MLLRSGTLYKLSFSPPHKIETCIGCNRFWGNSEWNMMCSICSGYGDKSKVSPYWGFEDPKYQKKLTDWVTDSTKNNTRYLPILNTASRQLDTTILKEILHKKKNPKKIKNLLRNLTTIIKQKKKKILEKEN